MLVLLLCTPDVDHSVSSTVCTVAFLAGAGEWVSPQSLSDRPKFTLLRPR